MSLITCSACSTRYAPGLERCPHCGSADRVDGGARLPWVEVACPITACAARGVRRRVYLRQPAPGVVEEPRLRCGSCGAVLPVVAGWGPWRDPEGGDQPSAGSSSETSAEKPETSPETSSSGPRKRARTTGSRSGGGRRGSSTAGSTDTSGPAEGPTLALGLTAKASAEVKAGGE
jgi:hypothetical protein